MSEYFVKKKGWRYDFTQNGKRYTNAWFQTKKEALEAEAKRKEELSKPLPKLIVMPQTDMGFLELVNKKLDHVKAYNSESHYRDYCYTAKRWVKRWGKLICKEITKDMVQKFMLERMEVSPYTANQDLRCLRAVFNFGKKMELIEVNPTDRMPFFPVEKTEKYVPSSEDIDRVIQSADPHAQDYLWTVRETLARISEIHNLLWEDVDFMGRCVTLKTRKKKGGNLTSRKVPMTNKLYEVLSKRFSERDKRKPWVFWHRYRSRKTGELVTGPYTDRKDIMWNLCEKAGVRYFRFHALRHAGASIMVNNNVPIRAIQKILGHENISTTEIYLHSIGTAEREAISTYETAREKSHTESHTSMVSEDEKRGQISLTP